MNWFHNLKTITKLRLGFGFVLLMTLVISLQALEKLAEINKQVSVTLDRDVLGLQEINYAAESQLKCARFMRNVVIATGDSNDVETNIRKMDSEFATAHEHLRKAESMLVTANGRAFMVQTKATLAEYETACDDIVNIARHGDFKAAKAAIKGTAAVSDAIVAAFGRQIENKEGLLQRSRQQTSDTYANVRTSIIVLAAAAIFLGILISSIIANATSRPLAETVRVLERVASGDFTQRLDINTADEIGAMARALNKALTSISAALHQVRGSANNLTTASEQLAGGSAALQAGAQSSTANLEETSASLEEVTSTVRQNSENSKQASSLTATASNLATTSGEIVESAIGAMVEINESSAKIADIIGSIDEIAFQTNLLAVNAAVEAAHAGEHGRGFAVVAQEVRALAQRSASSAKQIKNLISESLQKVERGTSLVNQSGDALKNIVTSVKRASDVVLEISAACTEQATAMEQIATAVSQINHLAQESSLQTDRIANTAADLAQQSTDLKQTLSSFVLPQNNLSADTAPPSRARTPAAAGGGFEGPGRALQSLQALGNKVARKSKTAGRILTAV